MLGISAIAQLALCQFPPTGSPAWRRLVAEADRRMKLNRQAPRDLVWYDPDEEEEAILIEILSAM